MTTTTGLLKAISPTTLFAEYTGVGTVSVDRYDDEEALCKVLGRRPTHHRVTRLIVSLGQDAGDGSPMDEVAFHLDDDQEIAYIARAITALQAASEAMEAGQR